MYFCLNFYFSEKGTKNCFGIFDFYFGYLVRERKIDKNQTDILKTKDGGGQVKDILIK